MVSDATGCSVGYLRMATVASALLLHQAEADVIKRLLVWRENFDR
jgi:hypothetical protein